MPSSQRKLEKLFRRMNAVRQRMGLSWPEWEKRAGLTRGRVYDSVRQGSMPAADAMLAMARVVGTTVEWLLTGEDPKIEVIAREQEKGYDKQVGRAIRQIEEGLDILRAKDRNDTQSRDVRKLRCDNSAT